MSRETHYQALELGGSATPAEIRQAYERLSSVFDLDSLALYTLVTPEEQGRALQRIREAYRILSDPEARAAYDYSIGVVEAGSPGVVEDDIGAAPNAIESAPPAAGLQAIPAVESHVEHSAAGLHAKSPSDEVHADSQSDGGHEESPPAPELRAGSAADGLHADSSLAETQAAPLDDEEVMVLGDEDVIEIVESGGALIAQPLAAPSILEAIDGETEFTGALLQAVREARGISLKEVSERTRVGMNHLQSIEAESFELLPERVFLRGFLQTYARELRLDPARVAETYLRRRESRSIR